jgi:hypothetical protein
MNYRLEWRLLGRADRILDKGRIDGDFADRAAALETLNALLIAFPFRGPVRPGTTGGGAGPRTPTSSSESRCSRRCRSSKANPRRSG